MKTKLLLIASAILMAMNLQAQAPEKFNYQGIARDNSGAPLTNQALGLKISIIHNTTVDYSETHTVTTNDFGLYALIIGDGTPVFGGMASVDWDSGNKFIKVEIDPTGGTNYTDLGTTELLSVPYALYALESGGSGSGNPTGPAGGDLTGNYPNPALANNTVTSNKITNGAVATADLANDAVTAAKIDPMGATNGQVLKFDGTDWAPANDDSGVAGWGLSGNAATTADFIGTTNDEALRFKVNNISAGFIGNDNTAFGINSLSSATTASDNVAFGNSALEDNTTGYDNTAIGYHTLLQNTTGNFNVAVGEQALTQNTTGSSNTAIGKAAMVLNLDGYHNTALGMYALYSNITENGLTAVGYEALKSNTTGSANVAVGFQAMKANTTGDNNTTIGHAALTTNTTGGFNSAFGKNTLRDNTTGNKNTAFGMNALLLNTSGSFNSAFGVMSLTSNTGSGNSSFGRQSLYSNTSGLHNSSLGVKALGNNTTGDRNTAIGYYADVASGDLTNATAMGARALVGADNSLVLGSINGVNGATASTNVGIGTTTPTSTLDVVGTNTSGQLARFELSSSTINTNNDIIEIEGPSGSSGFQIIEATVGSDDVFVVQHNGNIETMGLLKFENGSNDFSIRNTLSVNGFLDFYYNNSLVSFITSTGTYTTSDRRLKENIEPAASVLDRVNVLNVVRYNYKKDESKKETIGYIAQELDKHFPEFVELSGENEENAGYYGVNYAGMSAVAIKAIQEQQKMIENLQTAVKQLKAELAELKK